MRRTLLGLLVAATAITLATYAWRGVYARYIADDYCTAAILASRGFWSSQGYWYRAWSGRFAFTFAIGIAEQFGPRAAMILPLLAISACTAIAARSAKWAAALAIVYATIDGAPDIMLVDAEIVAIIEEQQSAAYGPAGIHENVVERHLVGVPQYGRRAHSS